MGVSEGELKCVSEEDMALSVMRDGVIKMLLLFADNYWDFPLMVCALGSVEWMYLATSYSDFSDSILYISVFSVSCLSFFSGVARGGPSRARPDQLCSSNAYYLTIDRISPSIL